MGKRQEERLALEGNSVFQGLRMERDVLKEQNAALLEALIEAERLLFNAKVGHSRSTDKIRAAILAARGDDK